MQILVENHWSTLGSVTLCRGHHDGIFSTFCLSVWCWVWIRRAAAKQISLKKTRLSSKQIVYRSRRQDFLQRLNDHLPVSLWVSKVEGKLNKIIAGEAILRAEDYMPLRGSGTQRGHVCKEIYLIVDFIYFRTAKIYTMTDTIALIDGPARICNI